ncbi:LuxR family transcriptional regulator [Terasakiella sp.]|uniref:LuxR family transcriptional regulator n=1 Tax=Terasakiella sp. TaxID=2034861 RepID=UPI003AA7F419
MLTTSIQDSVTQLDKIDNLQDFSDFLLTLKDHLGFDHFTYAIFNSPNVKVRDPLVACSYQNEWLDYYFSEDCINCDPIVRAAQKSHTPYIWESLKKNKTEQAFMQRAQDFGISKRGMTIPIRRANNELALVSVCANANKGQWNDLMNYSVPIVRFIADYCHDAFIEKFTEAVGESEEIKLTARERECLLWTARGKSNWEIANILNVAERTVTFHIGNACTKLGVNGRFQATVKAIAHHIIYP